MGEIPMYGLKFRLRDWGFRGEGFGFEGLRVWGFKDQGFSV